MDVCSQCGHELGIGRFCVNCGHPVAADASPRGDPALAHVNSRAGSRTGSPESGGHRHIDHYTALSEVRLLGTSA